MKNTWYSFLPLLVVTVLALSLGALEANKRPEYFSDSSLETLKSLNAEHQMVATDLLTTEKSELVSELLQANAFLDAHPPVDARGLVVSLKDGNGLLLLQPVESLQDAELQVLGDTYQLAIPEFEEVELDQDLELFSPLYNWDFPFSSTPKEQALPPEDSVDLAEETVQVAVIDSGVDGSHEIFAGVTVAEGWNTLLDNTDAYDDVGHGTHVAGIIATAAPGVEIVPYKIVDSNGGRLSNVLEAMARALADEVEIMNTSFGLASPSFSLETMLEQAYNQGVIVVSAAGNNSAETGFYPAEYEHSISVASVDSQGVKLPRSNYGSWVDLAAYGYHVRSALPDGQYGYKTGTSQAAPVVSAAVARLLMSPHTEEELTFEAILSALQNSSGSTIAEGELAGIPIVE
ncbi:MAG: S8 family serine peptidase [Candidatus Gracilibacteria bacterium]|jgi:subtilisin family serine protease